MNDLNILDLYCGAGGFGTGFSPYFDVLDAVDMDQWACETYSRNHPSTRVIRKMVSEYLADLIVKDYDGIMGICGGPPCQDFSVLNQTKNPRSNRAMQLEIMVEAVSQLRPQFAVIENVASIPKRLKDYAIKSLETANYNVVARTIRAYDYGSVQIRRRWILVACRSRHIFPQPVKGSRTAKEILRGGTSQFEMTEKTLQGLRGLETGKWVALPDQRWKGYFIVDPNLPMPAIINATKNRYIRPNRAEYLSLKELALSQGFPESYLFAGAKSHVCQQLANAVPVELAKTFAYEIARKIAPRAITSENKLIRAPPGIEAYL